AWAPPGRYSVVLTMSGQSVRQPLALKPDPRIKADAADYARQFALAKEIERARVDVRGALREAEALHARLAKAATAAAPERRSMFLALDSSLTRIADPVADEPR